MISRRKDRQLFKLRHLELVRLWRVECTRRWRERYPEKYAAHRAVAAALANGSLIRPGKCARCGKECKPHAHHDDYSKPLQVEWICFYCHNIEHKNIEGLALRTSPVTTREPNPLHKTHCKRGHLRAEHMRRSGKQLVCDACKKLGRVKWNDKRRESRRTKNCPVFAHSNRGAL